MVTLFIFIFFFCCIFLGIKINIKSLKGKNPFTLFPQSKTSTENISIISFIVVHTNYCDFNNEMVRVLIFYLLLLNKTQKGYSHIIICVVDNEPLQQRHVT